MVFVDNLIHVQKYQIYYYTHLNKHRQLALFVDKRIHFLDIDYVQEMVSVKLMEIILMMNGKHSSWAAFAPMLKTATKKR